jgi:glutaminyl-peptide cyclotransferase
MKTVVAALIAVAACAAQTQPPAAPAFDAERAFADLTRLVEVGPRPAGSPALDRARDYIRKELKAAGLAVEEQPFEAQTPLGPVRMVNLRATLPARSAEPGAGAEQPRGRIVIGGHYDTKLMQEFRFVGASDGASSAAFLLEMARALKGRPNPLPIELLFLDGEEAVIAWDHPGGRDHTYGSRHYVEQLKKAGTVKDVRAFILIDMIGDKDLGIRREQSSTGWLKDVLWETARRLGRTEFIDEETPIEDDHLEFLAAGIPSVDIIDLDDPEWHTAGDSLDNVSPRSLQVVGDVLLAALPLIESRLR